MANNVLRWAFDQGGKPSEKFVLVVLADHAHKDGSGAFPGLARLQEKTGLSRSAVQRALTALEARGLIQPLSHRRGGHGKATVWRCCIEKSSDVTPFNSSDVTPFPQKNSRTKPKKSVIVRHNSSVVTPQPLEPLEPSSEEERESCSTCGPYGWTCSKCAAREQRAEATTRLMKRVPEADAITHTLLSEGLFRKDIDRAIELIAEQRANGRTINNPEGYARSIVSKRTA